MAKFSQKAATIYGLEFISSKIDQNNVMGGPNLVSEGTQMPCETQNVVSMGLNLGTAEWFALDLCPLCSR